jgi:hypothetical protein
VSQRVSSVVDVAMVQKGNTPLHLASRMAFNVDVVAALVGAGADANAANHRKETPLMIAASTNSVPVAMALVQQFQVDVRATDEVRVVVCFASTCPLHDAVCAAVLRRRTRRLRCTSPPATAMPRCSPLSWLPVHAFVLLTRYAAPRL